MEHESGGFAMKTGFLKLPLIVQGIVIMVVWSAVNAIYIWYNWPVNKFDFVPAFLPVFPVLISSRSGVWKLLLDLQVGISSGKRECKRQNRRYLFA